MVMMMRIYGSKKILSFCEEYYDKNHSADVVLKLVTLLFIYTPS